MGLKALLQNSRAWALVAVSTAVILAGLAGESGELALRYERGAVVSGEYWRLISGHFVHLGWSHLALNLAGLLLVWLLFERQLSLGQWSFVTLLSILVMDAGFFYLDRGLGWYVGLSGLLHGLFAAGAVAETWRTGGQGYLLLAFLVGKLLWEQLVGPLPLTEQSAGGPVIVNAHLYGALGGAAAAILILLRDRVSAE